MSSTEINPTTPPQTTPAETSKSTGKELIRREIKMYGHVERDTHGDACGNCVEEEKFIKSDLIKRESVPVKYQHIDVYEPEGQKAMDEFKFQNMPFTQDCQIFKKENGEEERECRNVEGWQKQDWNAWKPKQSQQQTQEEASKDTTNET